MKINKKFIIIMGLIIIVVGGLVYGCLNFIEIDDGSQMQEIEPQQEISDEQLRQTTVKLYYKEKDGEKLASENRSIDVKELYKNPYVLIVEMLINGPESETLEKLIPEGTKVNKAEIQEDILILDLSKEFLKVDINQETQKLIIYSIVNSLTELVEVNGVKFIIDGEENRSFENSSIIFADPYVRLN